MLLDCIKFDFGVHLFRHNCQVCKALEGFDRKVT
jgi:hypothetical protein